MQQPKSINKGFKTRNRVIGKERRELLTKNTLVNQIHFPKAVTYPDIDQCVYDWVNNDLELTYLGEKLPTYKLFSTQRLSEYSQMWQNVDEKGNINANFKTVTRESNPQHGENQGNYYNIPGNRDYVIFQNYVAEEKGDEVVQLYTMKQPIAINLMYTINIITTSYEILNEMNLKVHQEFKALEKYIFPNGFAMPMLLNNVGDESDYTIDDKKYYGQSYQIKVMAFIISEEDYNIKKIPSRVRQQFVVGQNSSHKIEKKKFDIGTFTESVKIETVSDENMCKTQEQLKIKHEEPNFEELYSPISGHSEVTIEDYIGTNVCWAGTDSEMYVNKKVVITIPVSLCNETAEFELDCDLEIETVSLSNIKSFHVFVNGEEIEIDNSDVSFNKEDIIKVEAVLKDARKEGSVSLICYDPNTIMDETEEITL